MYELSSSFQLIRSEKGQCVSEEVVCCRSIIWRPSSSVRSPESDSVNSFLFFFNFCWETDNRHRQCESQSIQNLIVYDSLYNLYIELSGSIYSKVRVVTGSWVCIIAMSCGREKNWDWSSGFHICHQKESRSSLNLNSSCRPHACHLAARIKTRASFSPLPPQESRSTLIQNSQTTPKSKPNAKSRKNKISTNLIFRLFLADKVTVGQIRVHIWISRGILL